MVDFAPIVRFHSLRVLADVCRAAWGAELALADRDRVHFWSGADPDRGSALAALAGALRPEDGAGRMAEIPGLGTVIACPIVAGSAVTGCVLACRTHGDSSPSERSFDGEHLLELLRCAAREIEAHLGDASSRAAPARATPRDENEALLGVSAAMRQVFRLLARVAESSSTVLIRGESGTGKELVARAIHERGARRGKPFVAQNCSALNDNLLESALFGHAKGAFTGAIRDQKGLFDSADGGTMFLDEIGDMSPALQVKLLRVLQEGVFVPVGGTEARQVDVRVIAATHKDLLRMMEQGAFREDLYYRIVVIEIDLPPLREREGDVTMLCDHFLRKHAGAAGRPPTLSRDMREVMARYPWPGNVRELENEIERLTVLGAGVDELPVELLSPRIRRREGAPVSISPAAVQTLKDAVETLERDLLTRGLDRTSGNRSQLARELGISRSNLLAKLERYGLDRMAGGGSSEREPA